MSVELTTQRLLLRPFLESDFEAVHAYASDPEAQLYDDFGPDPEEGIRGFFDSMVSGWQQAPQRDYGFVVVLRETGGICGDCTLSLSPDLANGNLTYMVARPLWGHGYATEAARAVVSFAFSDLHLHRISARCWAPNVASRRVLEKIGMQFEGCLRQAAGQAGHWCDLLTFGLLEDEWQ